jgi:trehalose-phosphatase
MEDLIASKKTMSLFSPTPYLNSDIINLEYKKSQKRYFFLDYDGTLTPIVKTPKDAIPSEKAINSLKKLTDDPQNFVYVISGRDRQTLEEWLGQVPRLGLSAEHGCFLKKIHDDSWTDLIIDHNPDWKAEVLSVFDYFTERTSGSFIEQKSASITWHYRSADPEFGSWQAKECQGILENTIVGKLPVEIIVGKKNLEVRPVTVNKGTTLKKILFDIEEEEADFVFCAGDDRTDEDMFKALNEVENEIKKEEKLNFSVLTCTIGSSSKKTLAKYHLNNSDQVIHMLTELSNKKIEN